MVSFKISTTIKPSMEKSSKHYHSFFLLFCENRQTEGLLAVWQNDMKTLLSLYMPQLYKINVNMQSDILFKNHFQLFDHFVICPFTIKIMLFFSQKYFMQKFSINIAIAFISDCINVIRWTKVLVRQSIVYNPCFALNSMNRKKPSQQ